MTVLSAEQREVRDACAGTPAAAARLIAALEDPDARPAPGEWSGREVVLHLAATDILWHERLYRLATEEYPIWPSVEPPQWVGPGDESAAGALEVFGRFRAETIARLDALDEAGWARRGRHVTFGELDVAALMRVLLDHDQEHLGQIRGA